jgi:hypothetical protein
LAQLVGYLPSKHEALNSNPSIDRKKEGRKEGREGGREQEREE